MHSRRGARHGCSSDNASTADCDRLHELTSRGAPAAVPVVRLLDAGLGPALEDVRRQLDSAFRKAPQTLLIDMSSVTEVSSTTIAALLWINRKCSARGVDPWVRRPSRRNLDSLEKTGLLEMLKVEHREHPEA